GAGLVAVAASAGVASLGALIAPGPWRPVATVVAVLVAAAVAGVRHVSRSRVTPSVCGLVAGLVVLVSLYGGASSTPGLPLPTPATFDRLLRLAAAGADAVVDGRIPVAPSRGLELLVVAGTVAVVLVTDALALALGRAGLAGLPLLGLWVPVLAFERDPGVVAMVVGGAAYLLLLTLTRAPAPRATGGRDAAPALGVAVVVGVLAVAVGPAVAALPGYGSMRLPGSWGGAGVDGPLRLSTDLDMRSSLGARSDRPVLTYTTDAERVGPLRMYTMVEFDGREWQRTPAEELTAADGVLWPVDLPAAPDEALERLSVRVGDLQQDRLPVPTEPRALELAGSWYYDAARDEVVAGGGRSTQGLSYEVTIAARDLSAETLRADTVGVVAPDDPTRTLPDSPHADQIRALAQEVTAQEDTAYDQALALQSFFRDGRSFRYDTRVPPPETEDAVWDFLTQRSGYCVQFATGMTVMARTLGIPARLAVGFLPGTASRDVVGEFVVSGRQAHAWPELYFADAGWVRFEPTPAVQTGAPPSYADPFAGLPITPEEAEPSASASAPAAAPVAPGQEDPGTDGQVGIGTASVPTWLVVGASVTLGLALALGALAWRTRRRRRGPRLPTEPEGWWALLRARLTKAGISWSDSATPRQVAARLRDDLPDQDPAAHAQALEAADRLVDVVERSRYAPGPVEWDVDALQGWVEAVLRPVEAGSDQAEPRRRQPTATR
ncbi:DUF3488 and transglutaminase-like domain-containing protein, partial [Actinotalea sp. JY-7885]